MNQCRRLECLSGSERCETGRREASEFCVHQWEQIMRRTWVGLRAVHPRHGCIADPIVGCVVVDVFLTRHAGIRRPRERPR